MSEFAQLLFQGVSLGATYALIALGFVVVYRASGVISFAQGAMLLAGAYVISWLATDVGVAFLPAVLAAIALLALAGAGFQALVLRRVSGEPTFVLVMITIGAGIAVTSLIEALFGSAQRLPGDLWGSSSFAIGDVTINWVKLWGIGVTCVALAAHFAFDRWTRWGLAVQATAEDEEATMALGVPVRRVHLITWAMAGALATLGASSSPAFRARLSPRSGTRRCGRFRRSCSAGCAAPPARSSPRPGGPPDPGA